MSCEGTERQLSACGKPRGRMDLTHLDGQVQQPGIRWNANVQLGGKERRRTAHRKVMRELCWSVVGSHGSQAKSRARSFFAAGPPPLYALEPKIDHVSEHEEVVSVLFAFESVHQCYLDDVLTRNVCSEATGPSRE